VHKFSNLSECEITKLAHRFAEYAAVGQTILLDGPVGAGKSHFSRALIQQLMAKTGMIEDVPSPTFTLVQTYETQNLDIWHADLYRLSTLDEVYELGLEEALETSMCLVEWPNRLGELKPEHALSIEFEIAAIGMRNLQIRWTDPKWGGILAQLKA
jgi:tRNA threonylcarbamoyladenosine biosynthesis protein TsaE